MKTTAAILLAGLLVSVPVFGAEKISIAILDMEAKGVSQADAEKISMIIRNEMSNCRTCTIIDHPKTTSPCSEVACAVREGKKLGARKVLMGSLMKLGEQLTIICRMVDVEKESVDFSEKERALTEGDEIYMAERLCDRVSMRLTGKSLYSDADNVEESRTVTPDAKAPSSYKRTKDPFLWIAVGSGVAAVWGLTFTYASYKGRHLYLHDYTRAYPYFIFLFASFNLDPSFLYYTYLEFEQSRRRHDHRAEKLRNRNYYICASVGGFSAIMFITFLGRSIANSIEAGKKEKAGDVSLVMPALYEDGTEIPGQKQFAFAMGLSVKF